MDTIKGYPFVTTTSPVRQRSWTPALGSGAAGDQDLESRFEISYGDSVTKVCSGGFGTRIPHTVKQVAGWGKLRIRSRIHDMKKLRQLVLAFPRFEVGGKPARGSALRELRQALQIEIRKLQQALPKLRVETR